MQREQQLREMWRQKILREMEREQIREALKGIFEEETGHHITILQDQSRLIEEIGIDSVDVAILLMQVEHQFRMHITSGEFADMNTIGSLIDLIQSKVSESAVKPRDAA